MICELSLDKFNDTKLDKFPNDKKQELDIKKATLFLRKKLQHRKKKKYYEIFGCY